MNLTAGKRLLILGGKPIGSCEIVQRAREMGIYTIVTDYLPKEQSAAKQLADESWEISTADVELLAQKIKDEQIDGVYTGVHEFNITRMIEICEKLDLPCFCTMEQWERLVNKCRFKELCRSYQLPSCRIKKRENLWHEMGLGFSRESSFEGASESERDDPPV